MLLMVELVVVVMVNLAMVKMVIKGVEEQFISYHPDLQSLLCFFYDDHWVQGQ